MTYFAVIRERDSGWDDSRPMHEQENWDEHASFMNALVDDGFVVLGGPLGVGRSILLVVNAESKEAVRTRIAADPWTTMKLLRISSIEPWQIVLGDSPTA
jgi:uncharacterized protein YciI